MAVREAQRRGVEDLEGYSKVEKDKLTSDLEEGHKFRQKHAQVLLSKKIAAHEGIDYERAKSLEWTIESQEDWKAKQELKRLKRIDDLGDKNTAQATRYWRDISQMNPDLQEYHKEQDLGVELCKVNTKGKRVEPPSEVGLQRLSDAIDRQELQKRKRIGKRHSVNLDVNYINDDNARYNRKLNRHYGKFVKEVSESLERGTAL